MIHYHIAYTGVKDSSPHGVVFRRMAEVFNRKYGWNIKVTSSTRGIKPAKPQPDREFLVLALLLDSGEHLFSVVNPRYAHEIDCNISCVSRVKSFSWYTTRDRYFMEFPRVRSLRGRRVSMEVYEKKTAEMTPIVV